MNIVVGAPSTYSDWVLACENLAQQLTNFGMPAECQPRDVNVYWDDQDALDYDIDIGWFGVAWGTATRTPASTACTPVARMTGASWPEG
ncbi:MAG: hypothetical protein M5R40_12790 [Anaerolineae bacterium]|nr:hypothetical protein [Anaerolineae bacterium]